MNVPTAGQKRFVIVGATGMVAGYTLRYALELLREEQVFSARPASIRFAPRAWYWAVLDVGTSPVA